MYLVPPESSEFFWNEWILNQWDRLQKDRSNQWTPEEQTELENINLPINIFSFDSHFTSWHHI